eukprot:TRINITY_DN1970_c1_g1_i1.p1 TRINITY_DN1970_c1_g1~~TRINITY_DN1970_c1_g1_i1.p1  ORF type:complete len:983 (+),score=210.54 TRINITY_DN1970_c1_g1_i1:56-3004(+)
MKRWSLAIKDCMGADVRGMLGAFEEPTDWVEQSPAGKVVNPAQTGGGVVREKLVDIGRIDIDARPRRNEGDGKWLVANVVRSDLGRKHGMNALKQKAGNALLPDTSLTQIYKSRHTSLDTATTLTEKLETSTVPDTVVTSGNISQLLSHAAAPHPLSNGPALTPEDSMSHSMEADRRKDSETRMKYEVFTNKITQRTMHNQFVPDRFEGPKSVFKFYYDGDDLQYNPHKPVWRQMMDQRKGVSVTVGGDLDAKRLKNFQKYIRRVSQLGSPETVGDLQKMLSEQRALVSDLKDETFSTGTRYNSMTSRRDAFMRRRMASPTAILREQVNAELPLVERIVSKRKSDPRKMLTTDEAFELAEADVDDAKASLLRQREHLKEQNFSDEREDKLVPPTVPTAYLPEHKRATRWLADYSMPGDLEDPRTHSPFLLAQDTSTPLTSELKGRKVGVWEAADGAGMPGTHRAVAEKIKDVFDYQRATDRVSLGLQEKAVADWRPTKSVDEAVFQQTQVMKGGFDRRPIGFWSKENPDLRTTTQWDDVIGAPVASDGNTIDRVRFYQVRARWEKRKALAIQFGLEPKPDETIQERNIRRVELDKRLEHVVENKEVDGAVLAAWSDDRRNEQWHGKRHNRDTMGDRMSSYPLTQRPLGDLLAYQSLSDPRVREEDLSEEVRTNQKFNQSWFKDDAELVMRRRNDPRVDYLASAGIKPERLRFQVGCAHYMQVQDALWELRVYRNEPEPGQADRTWLENTTFINMMNVDWAKQEVVKIEKELEAKLLAEYRTHSTKEHGIAEETMDRTDDSQDSLGWKSPSEIDKWRTTDGAREGLELERELSYPIAAVNNMGSHRWLAKTPWDRLAANSLVSKQLRPEDDARGTELGPSFYFNRNRQHYYRMPVQRYRAYGPELREMQFLSEKLVPHDMVRKIKNYYAVARHNMIPFFSEHVGKNGPKFMHTPKVTFDHIGLHDDLEDYVRINPHLAKWEEM